VGGTVRVEYQDKHPDQVELALSGDDRYDIALSNREEREQHKAERRAGTPPSVRHSTHRREPRPTVARDSRAWPAGCPA
jgi:hypothetical protein